MILLKWRNLTYFYWRIQTTKKGKVKSVRVSTPNCVLPTNKDIRTDISTSWSFKFIHSSSHLFAKIRLKMKRYSPGRCRGFIGKPENVRLNLKNVYLELSAENPLNTVVSLLSEPLATDSRSDKWKFRINRKIIKLIDDREKLKIVIKLKMKKN